MNTSQALINASQRANRARIALQGIPNEAAARRAVADIREAVKDLRAAEIGARQAVVDAKARDKFERSERQATADSWLKMAGELAHG